MENNDDSDRCRLPSQSIGDPPWLVYTHGKSKKKKIQTFCKFTDSNNNNNNNNNNIVYIKSIPELRGKKIRGTFHGWLVLRDVNNRKMFSLWNIARSQSLDLPPLPYLPTFGINEGEIPLSGVVLTAPIPNTSTTADCVLLLFFNFQVFWCRPRLRRNARINWVAQKLVFDGKILCVAQAAILKGVIYSWAKVVATDGPIRLQVVSMRMVDGELKVLSLQHAPIISCKHTCIRTYFYVLESCGLLYLVNLYLPHEDGNIISVSKVWELDPPTENWVEVKCLNGRAFFLGPCGSTWCWGSDNDSTVSSSSSSVGYRKDCLYLALDKKRILYSYSLAERSMTPFQTYQNLQTSVVSENYWLNVKPQHYRLAAIQDRKEHNRKTQIHIIEEKVADEGTEATESLLISILPTDMISLISEHLHLFEYRNFRASCKMFRSLVSPLPKRTNKLLPVPILIFFTTDDGQCRMIDPSRDDDSYYCNHLQLPEYPFTVHFCKDGWIVIHDRQLVSLKYLNPLTRVKQDFPLDEDLKISDLKSFGFSTNPTSPDCVTVVFDHDDFGLVLIHYIQYGDQKWKDCRLENQVDFFFAGYSCPLYFAGAFYVLGVDGRLGEFKVLGDGQQSWRIYKKPTTRIKYLHSYHLVECHGDLLAVFIGHMGTWVEVYKFNLSKRKWIQVKSLGNYCLFVSNSSSFSAEPTEAWMRNRIYVPRIKGNRIVFYSLDTCKFHVSGIEDDSLVNLFGTTEPLHCFWFWENCA
ncbi:hypothetical protein RDABS01_032929 [Bienertia sinuspersici]